MDFLNGTDKADVIVGLKGLDRINGRRGNDFICAGPGPPEGIYEYSFGGRGDDKINTGGGLTKRLAVEGGISWWESEDWTY
jgi:hypothetical protein